MKNNKTGAAAFPAGYPHNCEGMTLRDYFAAKAMIISMEGSKAFGQNFVDEESYEDLAKHAYKIADAMLKARGEDK